MPACITQPAAAETLNVLGGLVTLQLTGRETAGAYTMAGICNAPGTGVPLHIHTHEDETFHVIEGQVEFTVGDQVSVAGPGVSAHLPRGIAHGFRAVGDQPARVLVTVSPAGIEDMFRRLAALPASPPEMAKVLSICGEYGITFV